MNYSTGEIGLQEEKFEWRKKKVKTLELTDIYDFLGNDKYAERARICSTWLQFTTSGKKKILSSANFCHLRLCPICIARRASKNAWKLSKVMNAIDQKEYQFLFLTLTIRNCNGEKLGENIDLLTRSWSKLSRHRAIERAVKGYFRAVEVTRNKKTGQFHPHLHVILCVPKEYGKKSNNLYINQEDWERKWQKALRVDYKPRVYIMKTKNGKGAVYEAAKYTTKDGEYIAPELSLERASVIVDYYTKGLARKRLTAFGGLMKKIAKEMEVDNMDEDKNLVNVDEESIRDDVADLILTYNWNFGAGDYVLTDILVNQD